MRLPGTIVIIIFVSIACINGQDRAFTRGNNRKTLESVAKMNEIKPMAEEPSWAKRLDQPLATIGWVSDTHIGVSKGALERTRSAFHLLKGDLKADCVIITGDNNAQSKGLPKRFAKLPKSHRNQIWMKQFIEQELGLPYVIIPGDNWPWDFEKVFGSPTRSLDIAGYHFVFTATDAKAMGNDACTVFFDDTKAWLTEDLKTNVGKPTFFVVHETLVPPLFLDVPWTQALVGSNPQVLAVLSGHLHFDMDFQEKTFRNILCPAIGPGHVPAFKVIKLYPDAVILLTYEWDGKAYNQAKKWQLIQVPERLRCGQAFKGLVNVKAMPIRPKVRDQKLLERAKEVDQALVRFMAGFGLRKMFWK